MMQLRSMQKQYIALQLAQQDDMYWTCALEDLIDTFSWLLDIFTRFDDIYFIAVGYTYIILLLIIFFIDLRFREWLRTSLALVQTPQMSGAYLSLSDLSAWAGWNDSLSECYGVVEQAASQDDMSGPVLLRISSTPLAGSTTPTSSPSTPTSSCCTSSSTPSTSRT